MGLKLKMVLRGTRIKRVATIPGDISLEDLHGVIQVFFGFKREHPWKFQDRNGNVYSARRDTVGGESIVIGEGGALDPAEYKLGDVLSRTWDVIRYKYDYGDGWEILVTRMTDPRDDKIACLETDGSNAMEGIGGFWGLDDFTEALRIYEKEERAGKPHKATDRRIAEWGYDDADKRRKFLAGPTRRELTKLLINEIDAARQR